MADVLAILAMTALLFVAIAFVYGCDRLIGRDEVALAEEAGPTVTPEPDHAREAA